VVRYLFDSTSLRDIPADAQMAAGYYNGAFAFDLAAFSITFPHVPRLLIDVNGQAARQAHVRDWENGDKAGSLEQWVIDNKQWNPHPTVYCNRSTIQEVRQLTGSQVLARDYWLWIATLDGTYAQSYPFAPVGVVAVQAWGQAQLGIHADRSVVFDDSWFPSAPPSPVYAWEGVVTQMNLVSYKVGSNDGGNTWHRI
jgi:hypothetical protein